MKNRLYHTIYDSISSRFQVLYIIDSVHYDYLHPDILEEKIKIFENFTFKENQRLLIYYHDTGFYQHANNGCSVFFFNLFQLFKKFNIPAEFVIIFTNHYGLKNEIDQLNSIIDYSMTNIVETSLWHDYPLVNQIKESQQHKQDIKKTFLYTCLNNAKRVHRVLTLCYLKEKNLLEKGIISYRFKS